MEVGEHRLSDEAGVAALVEKLARDIQSGLKVGRPFLLIGIRSRGVPLAERIAARIAAQTGLAAPVGALDITLYRDDFGKADRWPVLKGTEIPFPVEGAEVVLIDDVLYTGRTVRAAMNCVCDLGRPAAVRLAVLVDRGGRELPIQADYAGLVVEVKSRQRVAVRLRPIDEADEIVSVSA
jgi:pyrimidine operon attenuation protein / uracil phosphoribosyltransferase